MRVFLQTCLLYKSTVVKGTFMKKLMLSTLNDATSPELKELLRLMMLHDICSVLI